MAGAEFAQARQFIEKINMAAVRKAKFL